MKQNRTDVMNSSNLNNCSYRTSLPRNGTKGYQVATTLLGLQTQSSIHFWQVSFFCYHMMSCRVAAIIESKKQRLIFSRLNKVTSYSRQSQKSCGLPKNLVRKKIFGRKMRLRPERCVPLLCCDGENRSTIILYACPQKGSKPQREYGTDSSSWL